MRIAFFEDSLAAGFSPIALTRPVFELLCGSFSLRKRFQAAWPGVKWGGLVRNYLRECYQEEHPQAHINDALWLAEEPTLLINGRWLPSLKMMDRLKKCNHSQVGMQDGSIVYLLLDPAEAMLINDVDNLDDVLVQLAESRDAVEAEGKLLSHPWDLVNWNGPQLEADFELSRQTGQSSGYEGQVEIRGSANHVAIDATVDIDPYVLLDAREGPITIAKGAVLQAFTRIEGPCYIGPHTQLFRANIRETTSIGPVCRVGGEIEASIIHGYANKYHDGFLGHAYVCPWVNLGAISTNSDLKNDYSNVRVPLAGKSIETGTNKVGCFIGDHTKTALGSLFNTGSSIGVMSMILPGGELLPKHIPSFSRVWHGALDDHVDLESSFVSAQIAMGRRQKIFTPAQQRMLRALQELTVAERQAAIAWLQNKQPTGVSIS